MLATRWRRLPGFSAVAETTVCVGLEALHVGLNGGYAENSFVFPFFLFISFADAVSSFAVAPADKSVVGGKILGGQFDQIVRRESCVRKTSKTCQDLMEIVTLCKIAYDTVIR